MAITSAICNSFKTEILTAVHNFTASSGNTFNIALYTSDATLNKSTTASFTARGCLIFNDSASGDPAVCAIDFGSDKTVTSGTFTIQFPTADASNAIIRIA
jgi:hypothetical protein